MKRIVNSFEHKSRKQPTLADPFYYNPSNRRHGRYSLVCGTNAALIWMAIIVIMFCEYFYFHYTIARCQWPSIDHKPHGFHINPLTANEPISKPTTNIVLIGDPQLTDKYSYWFMKIPLLGKLVEFHSDIYMRKNFQLLLHYHQLDAVIFMGDLFDSGRMLNDRDFESEFRRFDWIFETNSVRKIPKLYLSGNHDIGYDLDKEQQAVLAERFEKYFSPLNFKTVINGISFVFVSATTLDTHTANTKLVEDTLEFVHSHKNTTKLWEKNSKRFTASEMYPAELPRVLLHHVPLWRPPGTDCGSWRSRNKAITDRVGHSYTNMLPTNTTEMLLTKIKPFVTFSGDDHDHCKVRHSNITTEFTVGTFSWMQGNPYPSFVMLSIEDNSDMKENFQPKYRVDVCFTANRRFLFQLYIILYFLGILLLLIDPFNPERKTQPVWTLPSYLKMFQLLLFRLRMMLKKICLFSLFLVFLYSFLVWLAV